MSPKQLISQFRQPEYVGENRCLPCTAVNLVIALVAALLTGAGLLAGGISTPISFSAGVAVLAGCVLIVYLRGYLIPGTPTLTKRYLPHRILRLFGKAPEPNRDGAGNVDIETALLEAGALEPCADRDDLCLTPSFKTDWRSRIETLATADPGIDHLIEHGSLSEDVDRADITFEARGDAYIASIDNTRIAQWESRPAYIADAAAATELRDRYPGWRTMDFRERTALAGSLRLWLERCPACDGSILMQQETVESCCRERKVLASSCEGCGRRLFEADIDPGALTAD